jgi:rhodanese-related sulfurtransferase
MGQFSSLFQGIFGGGTLDPKVHLEPQAAHQALKGEHPPLLVDVRTPEEHREARIPGSILIPLHDLGRRLKELDKRKSILLYCRGGNRSSTALHLLQGHHYLNVAHIRGGITAWARQGLPIEP